MRKALIGILMAATVATPLPAVAQTAGSDGVRAERRAERQQQRTQRRAERQEQRARTPAASWPGQQERARRVVREAEANQRPERREDRLERREERVERRQDRVERRQDRVEERLERRGPDPRLERRADRLDRREDRLERRADRIDRRQDRVEHRQDRRDWNRNWRSDRRYDWQRWRYQNRNIFRLGSYYAPYRHNYSRFSIGFRIGQPFYSSRYWINDPWSYRLPPAYAGTRWVRYYDDVLLVDLYTGEVIDVIYDFFW